MKTPLNLTELFTSQSGGTIHLYSEGVVILNGSLKSDGSQSGIQVDDLNKITFYGGGGSGGVVYLTAQNVTGTGNISVQGGSSDQNGFAGEVGRSKRTPLSLI